MYWKRAAERPLNISPDLDLEGATDEYIRRVGPKFLRLFEEERGESETMTNGES